MLTADPAVGIRAGWDNCINFIARKLIALPKTENFRRLLPERLHLSAGEEPNRLHYKEMIFGIASAFPSYVRKAPVMNFHILLFFSLHTENYILIPSGLVSFFF